MMANTTMLATAPIFQKFGGVGLRNIRQHQSPTLPFTPSVSIIMRRISPSKGMHRSSSVVTINKIFCSSSSANAADELSRLVNTGCKLVGCGSGVPTLEVSNDDLTKMIDTSDEWIYGRTVILNRRVLSGKDNLTELAVKAATKALEMAQVNPEDVDLILLCSSTGDDRFGGATLIQKALGCKSYPLAYDITAACGGFLLGLFSASCHIKAGGYKNVLVIGAEAITRFVDWTERSSCFLFGDGVGGVLVQACDDGEDCFLGFDLHSDGDGKRHVTAAFEEIETNHPVSGFQPKGSYSYLKMNGKEVLKFAIYTVPQSIQAALAKSGIAGSSFDWLVVHQANKRMIDAIAKRLEVPSERVIYNVENYGNTGAASIPMALDEAVRTGKVQAGHVIASAGFGAGLTWVSAIFRWK